MKVIETLVGGGLLLVFAYLVLKDSNATNQVLQGSSKALGNIFTTLQGRTAL